MRVEDKRQDHCDCHDDLGHGPRYCVNTEGNEHDWTRSTITTEEIAALGGWPASQGVIQVNEDNTERTLAPGEVVELRPGHAFCRRVRWKRGFTRSERIVAEDDLLRRLFPEMEVREGWRRVPKITLPSGWNRADTDVAFQISDAFSPTASSTRERRTDPCRRWRRRSQGRTGTGFCSSGYLGKVPHNGAVYDGEHEAIIDEDLFRRVQAQLKLAGERGGASVKNLTGSLLGGLVRCKGCECAMSPSSASKKKPDGSRTRYRYYVCCNAVKRGRQHCAAPSLPGPALEAFVLDQVKAILADSPQMAAVVTRAIDLLRQAASARIAEQTRLRAVLERLSGEEPTAVTRREIERVRRTLAAVCAQVAVDADRLIDEDEVAGAVEAFDGVWNAMTQAERAEFLHVVIASVEYDGQTQDVSITFNPELNPAETPSE